MNENDLIAEYVKEHYPQILESKHFEFFKLRIKLEEAIAKLYTIITEAFDNFRSKLAGLSQEELKEIQRALQKKASTEEDKQ